MSAVAAAFTNLLRLHQDIGSRVPHFLRAPVIERELQQAERQLGFTLHPDLVALYRIADGIDERLWYAHQSQPPGLLPHARFPSLGDALEETLRFRQVAQELGDQEALWRSSWFSLFPLYSAEVLALDCREPDYKIWFVYWESDDIRPVANTLPHLLGRTTERMREAGVSTTNDGYTLMLPETTYEGDWY